MNNGRFFKILVSGMAFLLLLIGGFQLYKYLFVTVRTIFATEGQVEDSFLSEGLIARTETVLSSVSGKSFDVLRKDGEKISKGGIVAQVYTSEEAASAQVRLRAIKDQITQIQQALSTQLTFDAQNELYTREIWNNLYNLSKSYSLGSAQNSFAAMQSFVDSVTKYQIATGELKGYEDVLRNLQQQESLLKKQTTTNVKLIESTASGYYCSVVDGFEEEIAFNALNEFKVDQFNALFEKVKNSDIKKNGVGKVIDSYKWQYITVVPAKLMDGYKVGKNISIRFAGFSQDIVKGKIVAFNTDGENVLVVIEMTAMLDNLLSQRSVEVEIIRDSFEGICIDAAALRKVDGKDAIYVKSGPLVKLKKVTVLYLDEQHAVLEYEPTNSNGVQIHDQVITHGRDLYDGKILS